MTGYLPECLDDEACSFKARPESSTGLIFNAYSSIRHTTFPRIEAGPFCGCSEPQKYGEASTCLDPLKPTAACKACTA